MHTVSLSSPDEKFYMTAGATSHMTRSQGTLLNYSLLKCHLNNVIIVVVCNGHIIPVHGHRHLSLPSSKKSLTFKNVLPAPKLIKNLIYVRKFTQDSMIFVEFDHFGFSVKDWPRGTSS